MLTRLQSVTDADGRLVREAITADPNASNRTFTYRYDLAGNRITMSDSGTGGADLGYDAVYQYDANDRLVKVTQTKHVPPNHPILNGTDDTTTYAYDRDGNTTTQTAIVYNSQNGSHTTTVTTHTWDIEGRLVATSVRQDGGAAQTTSFTYDDAGNRVGSAAGGHATTELNDPLSAYDQALEEYSDGILAATFVRGLDILMQDRSGTQSYFAMDGLGSTRALTNTAGSVTDTYAYDAFGGTIAHTGTTVNAYQFAGQINDGGGSYHMGAREYQAATGRFNSRDSYDGRTSEPITLNHYLYAGADPVDHIDPTGHDFSLSESITVGAIGGGLFGFSYGAYSGAKREGTYFSFRVLAYGVIGGVIGAGVGAGAGYLAHGLFTSVLSKAFTSQPVGSLLGELSGRFSHPSLKRSIIIGALAGLGLGVAAPESSALLLTSAAIGGGTTTFVSFAADVDQLLENLQDKLPKQLWYFYSTYNLYRNSSNRPVTPRSFIRGAGIESAAFLAGFAVGFVAGLTTHYLIDQAIGVVEQILD